MNQGYGNKAWAREATHLLGEVGDGSGAGEAMRSFLRTDSACGFETSATAKQGRCSKRASGAPDGQTETHFHPFPAPCW